MGSPFTVSSNSLGNTSISMATAYCTYYNNAMSSYNNVMSGYQSLENAQYAAEAPITAGYQNLYNTVMGTISGVETSQLQAIQCQYTKANASTQQQMINAGLGNSTVLASMQRGNCAQKSLATTQAQNQFAQLQAGYESQLGLAGLNWQQQALAMNTALGVQQLKCMMIPLPNPSGFMAQYQNLFGTKPTAGSGPYQKSGGGVATPPKGNTPGAPCMYGGGGSGMYGTGFCAPNPYANGYLTDQQNQAVMNQANSAMNDWSQMVGGGGGGGGGGGDSGGGDY